MLSLEIEHCDGLSEYAATHRCAEVHWICMRIIRIEEIEREILTKLERLKGNGATAFGFGEFQAALQEGEDIFVFRFREFL